MGAVITTAPTELYRISSDGEYATICIDDWGAPSGSGRQYYGGTVLVHSSFGDFCHTWTACAVPFRQFLKELSFERFMSKCLGAEFMRFDADASFAKLRQAILTHRREEQFTQDTARELWHALIETSTIVGESEALFLHELADSCNDDTALGPAEDYVVRTHSHQAVGFWNVLWSEFVAALSANTVEE